MKIGTAEVKSEKKVIGDAEYKIYEGVPEAIEDVGEAEALNLINVQTKTNAMNTLRQSIAGNPTKANLEAEAFTLCTPDELANVAGDKFAWKALLTEKLQEVHEKYGIKSKEAGEQGEAA